MRFFAGKGGERNMKTHAVYFITECVYLAESLDDAIAMVNTFDDTSGFDIVEITDENRDRILEDFGEFENLPL
jgi:hypothetical protein